MTKQEKSLLLYLESRAVDNAGRVAGVHMNREDFQIAKRWHLEGFVKFGRILSAHIRDNSNIVSTHWCELSEQAWEAAHAERKARALRIAHNPEIRTNYNA